MTVEKQLRDTWKVPYKMNSYPCAFVHSPRFVPGLQSTFELTSRKITEAGKEHAEQKQKANK